MPQTPGAAHRAGARVVGSPALALFATGAAAQDKPKIEITRQIPYTAAVRTAAFSPGGTRVLSAGSRLPRSRTTSGVPLRGRAQKFDDAGEQGG